MLDCLDLSDLFDLFDFFDCFDRLELFDLRELFERIDLEGENLEVSSRFNGSLCALAELRLFY
jgi:hypothetical protein